jgi:hypothetical protein
MTDASGPLTRRDRLALALLAFLFLALGVTTVLRSAFMMNPKTDFQVYARAAWAVRTGEDPYAVTDNNGWHYLYPVPFAIALTPLADPYPFLPRDGYLPFWLSAAIFYLLGLAAAIYAVHAFAAAVVDASPGSRRWWAARTGPFAIALGPILLTLTRGQVNTLVVALVAAGFAAAMRNRRLASGAWLAAAAVVKIIPTVLVFFPLARRDWRAVAGGVATAATLVLAVPAAIWDPRGAIEVNRRTVELTLAPVVSHDADQSRRDELHGTNSTFSQSVRAAVHTWMYPNPSTRPDAFAPVATWAHLFSSIALIGFTLLMFRRRLTPQPADQLLALGSLCSLMMLLTPVSHLHYHAYSLPLVAGVWLKDLADRPGAVSPRRGTAQLLIAWAAITTLPALPLAPFEWSRTAGFGTAITIALMVVGLRRMGTSEPVKLSADEPLRRRP